MGPARIDLVLTEHPPAISPVRERHYEDVRRQLERVAGVSVRSRRYCDVRGFDGAAAVVLSGSFAPWTAHEPAALSRFGEILRRHNGPVFGICAGMQLQTMFAGGLISPGGRPEVGFGPIEIVQTDGLLAGLGKTAVVYKHHADKVVAVPDGFDVLARSEACAVQAIAAPRQAWWGTQFHPECFDAEHPDGAYVLRNFFALAGLGTGKGGRARELS